jgi:hypothetical protein
MNPMLSGLDGFEGEQGIKVEQLERFPSVDWSKCASPPMTPGKFGLSRLGVSFPEFIYPARNSCMKIKKERGTTRPYVAPRSSFDFNPDSIDCRVSIAAIRVHVL